MAVIGAMIGEGVRKESSLLKLNVITNIAASAFLAYIVAFSLQSMASVNDSTLISLAGLFGYLGDHFSKGWLLKALKHYKIGVHGITETEEFKEEKVQREVMEEYKKRE